jgi:hypothetical protein
MYDVFFICYDESNREENWQRVLEFHPNAKRIDDIKGISNSHMMCNKLSTTSHFWTVDGDNWLLEELNHTETKDEDLIFYTALDCIDSSVSTIGAVKLWKKNSIINPDMSKGDFCKNATKNSVVVLKSLSIHKYDNTPYEAWRHTFRHMVKSFSGIISHEALELNLINMQKHKDLNQYSYRGYLDAKEYVKRCNGDFNKINLINDYDWLPSIWSLHSVEQFIAE